jgi:hypothetical protein
MLKYYYGIFEDGKPVNILGHCLCKKNLGIERFLECLCAQIEIPHEKYYVAWDYSEV